jgi:nucleoside-diphosphate-sugar epimerase
MTLLVQIGHVSSIALGHRREKGGPRRRRNHAHRTPHRVAFMLHFVPMPTAIVTGSGGLVGSESVGYFVEEGYDVIGLENNMRARFFGPSASTAGTTERLLREHGASFHSLEVDIRDSAQVDRVFRNCGGPPELVIHTAAQPSHDWAASEPHTDFSVNAIGTLNLLEATRRFASSATFIFCSTNKVYGDLPNGLPLLELEHRLDLPADHRYYGGIDTSMSIDRSTHSLFGVSKASADLLVQEYGRYFDMATVCFRGGCLTGPNHAGAQLHGFCPISCSARLWERHTRSSGIAANRYETTSTPRIWCPPLMRFVAGLEPPLFTTSAAAERATARCWRPSKSASG